MKKTGSVALLLTVALSAQAGIYQAWEFNTPGDTEGWYENGQFSGLTVQAAVNGAESVLTCADVTGVDPNVSFSTTQWFPDAGDTWSTFEMRVRLLDGNGGSSRPWLSSGSLFFPNWRIYGEIDDTTLDISVVDDGDNWVIATMDISGWGAGAGRIDSFRIDPVGNDPVKNFEIDYMRLNVSTPPEPPAARDIQSDTWVAVDALDRALPDYAEVGGQKTNRTVGMFYFIWHSQHPSSMNGGPYNIDELLAADPLNTAWGPEQNFHHWAEPEMGYFRADDPYVIRRNASMLVDAGVDVIILDVTNGFIYQNIYMKICEVFMQIRAEGEPTPQIAFITHFQPVQTVNLLYDNFYSQNLYQDLWFYWKGKPLLLADTESVSYSPTINNFFSLRHSWAWGSTAQDDWSWLDHYPQDYAWHESFDRPEQLSVSVAQHATTSIGRSYSNGAQPAVDQYHLTGTEAEGINFDEQWSRAHVVDPEFIYVTGWNEWVAQRFVSGSAGWFAGRSMPAGYSYFVDAFNREFNRDIDPMKGGHTDSYYYQLISNIRKYKGVRSGPVADSIHTISVDGLFDDWASVSSVYYDTYGDPVSRDWPGWADSGLTYYNQTGRNDILESRVVHDGTDLGFYVETAADLTPFTDPHWMELFINSDQDYNTGWEGYDYHINGYAANGTAVVDSYNGAAWVPVGTASYKEFGNKMELTVSRATLGLTANPVNFDFHWTDNIQSDLDIAEFFINGDSAPNRRCNYRYKSLAIVETTLRSNGFETGIAYGDWEITTAEAYAGAHSLECSADDNVGIYEELVTEDLDSFRVSFKYKLQNAETAHNLHVHYQVDGLGFVQVGDLGSENGVWLQYTDVRFNSGADASFFTNGPINFHINGHLLTESDEFLWIDDLEIIGYSAPLPLTPAESYAAWATLFGLDTNNTGAMEFDFEPDGMDNLAEYALGGNPTNNDVEVILPTFVITDAGGGSNVIDYIYNRRLDAAIRGLTYGLNENTNLLGEWSYVSNAYETGSVDIDPSFESVTNTIPIVPEKGFINLEVRGNF